ncbi:MAG: HAD-IA family hydrolase [Clostridia bacterium]|nr:HAD-IA family hydrolase [Clostridia bacterium]
MIKVVIFDLDDTLISERKYIKSGYRAVAKAIKDMYNLEIGEDDIYSLLNTLFVENSKQVFDRALKSFGICYSKEDILELVQVYRCHVPSIEYYDDVLDVISKLKDRNIRLGIITDGYIETQQAKLKVLDAYNAFEKIIVTEELGRDYWKPHPKSFQMMKEYFNVEYEEMLYVGDNPNKDFHIKKQLPISTARIIREYGIYKDEPYKDNIISDYLIKNLNQLLDIVK